MEPLNLKSQLTQHLESADAYTLSALAPADYSHAVYLFCSEKNEFSGGLRHASTADLDDDDMLPAISACADLAVAREFGDLTKVHALLNLMGACVEQALRKAATDKVTNELYEIAKRHQVDTRTLTYSPAKGLRVTQP